MLTTIGNIHKHKLPRLGAIGYITDGCDRYGAMRYWKGQRQRWQVVAFPLCDEADYHYSHGIHTAWFQNLRTGEVKRFSGFYFEEVPC